MDVPLSRGLVAVIDDSDYQLISRYKWSAAKDCHTFYARTKVLRGDGSLDASGKRQARNSIQMHRLIMNAKPGQQVDHIDGNGLNNRRSNLRVVDQCTNQRNRHHFTASSGTMGVTVRARGRFQAHMRREGKRIWLGTFKTLDEAVAARRRAIEARP